MALTDVQTAFFRSKLGSSVDLTDVETRLTRLADQFKVVLEILEERRSTLLSRPLSFTVPDYTENSAANVAALNKAIEQAQQDVAAGVDIPESGVRIVVPTIRFR